MRILVLLMAVAFLTGCITAPLKMPSREKRYIEPIPERQSPGFRKPPVELIALFAPGDDEYRRFSAEVPLEYDMLPEGYFLPLVEMNILAPQTRMWYKKVYEGDQIDGLFNTVVTFVVWEGDSETGYELARFVGYQSKEQFFEQVRMIIDMYDLNNPRKRRMHY